MRVSAGGADQPDPLQRQRGQLHERKRVEELTLHHQQPRTRVRQDVMQRCAAGGGVYRDEDRSEPSTTEKYLDKFRTVRAHQRDPIATPDAGELESACGPGGQCWHLSKTENSIAGAEQGLVAVFLGLILEHDR